METVAIKDILRWSKGSLEIRGKQATIQAISIDSRKECKDALFIPLKGNNFDGNDFVGEAIEKGAAAYITERDTAFQAFSKEVSCIKVGNALDAFHKIASGYRSKFNIKSIAITGSNGKTTTKEYVRSVASIKFQTICNEGTKNNHIGVPLTIFTIDSQTKVGVFELGMSGFGEIRNLAEVVRPEIGIITNVSHVHTEFFRSLNEVAAAKSELLEALPTDGSAILNADNDFFGYLKGKKHSKCISFGIDKKADVTARNLNYTGKAIEFEVLAEGKRAKCHINSIGRYNVYNALAAIASGVALDIPLSEACEGLLSASPPGMRFESEMIGSATVINDAYNANPASTIASLNTFDSIPSKGRRILVLGDMLELGWYSSMGHSAVGKRVADGGSDLLITVGKLAGEIASSAAREGFGGKIITTENAEEAAKILSGFMKENDIVLIKGSRALRLEKIVQILKKQIYQANVVDN